MKIVILCGISRLDRSKIGLSELQSEVHWLLVLIFHLYMIFIVVFPVEINFSLMTSM